MAATIKSCQGEYEARGCPAKHTGWSLDQQEEWVKKAYEICKENEDSEDDYGDRREVQWEKVGARSWNLPKKPDTGAPAEFVLPTAEDIYQDKNKMLAIEDRPGMKPKRSSRDSDTKKRKKDSSDRRKDKSDDKAKKRKKDKDKKHKKRSRSSSNEKQTLEPAAIKDKPEDDDKKKHTGRGMKSMSAEEVNKLKNEPCTAAKLPGMSMSSKPGTGGTCSAKTEA